MEKIVFLKILKDITLKERYNQMDNEIVFTKEHDELA